MTLTHPHRMSTAEIERYMYITADPMYDLYFIRKEPIPDRTDEVLRAGSIEKNSTVKNVKLVDYLEVRAEAEEYVSLAMDLLIDNEAIVNHVAEVYPLISDFVSEEELKKYKIKLLKLQMYEKLSKLIKEDRKSKE